MGSSNFHIVSNRNNRNLQRTGNRSFKTRKGDFFNRDIKQSDKPLHDQYNYADRTPPFGKRLLVMVIYLAMVVTFIYALINHSNLSNL